MKPTLPIVVALFLSAGSVVGSQSAAVVFHDLAAKAFETRGRLQLKAVVTDHGSIGLAEAQTGAVQAGHHHEQEQVVIMLAGQFDYSIGGDVHRVGVHGAVLTPSNSHHFYTNTNAGPSRFIEYQPVPRIDWQPPFPAYKVVQSLVPVPGPFGLPVSGDMSVTAAGWRASGSGARERGMSGQSIQLRMVDLPAAKANIELKAARGTSFLYVLDGTIEFVAGSTIRSLRLEGVAQIAGGTSFTLMSQGTGPALAAIFSLLP